MPNLTRCGSNDCPRRLTCYRWISKAWCGPNIRPEELYVEGEECPYYVEAKGVAV